MTKKTFLKKLDELIDPSNYYDLKFVVYYPDYSTKKTRINVIIERPFVDQHTSKILFSTSFLDVSLIDKFKSKYQKYFDSYCLENDVKQKTSIVLHEYIYYICDFEVQFHHKTHEGYLVDGNFYDKEYNCLSYKLNEIITINHFNGDVDLKIFTYEENQNTVFLLKEKTKEKVKEIIAKKLKLIDNLRKFAHQTMTVDEFCLKRHPDVDFKYLDKIKFIKDYYLPPSPVSRILKLDDESLKFINVNILKIMHDE